MRHRIALCILAFAGPACGAQEAGPRFVVHAKDGPLPAARLDKLSEGWSIETPDGALRATEWVGLQQERRARPSPPATNFIQLGSGDRLAIAAKQPVRLEEGHLHFTPAEPLRPAQGKELSVFAPHVALLMLGIPAGVDDPEVYLARLSEESRETDVVLLQDGDRIEGKVIELSSAGCASLANGKKLTTPWPKLAGIAFATTALARPRPKQTHALAVLAGGSRVYFRSLRFDARQRVWLGRTVTAADVAIPEQGLIALDLLKGVAVYLSELAPSRHDQTPYLGIRWPVGVDRAVSGRLLRVGDQSFDKGVGVHGACRLTYRLDGAYTWFEATAGLDPSAGTRGRARLCVVVDGKEQPLADEKERTAQTTPLSVQVDVRGARELTLVVESGSLGDVQCHVNWAGARLIKKAN